MLERAVGGLENACRLFSKESRGLVRSSRSLSPRFWHHAGAISALPQWFLAFLQISNQLSSGTPHDFPRGISTMLGTRIQFLDILCPPRAKQFLVSSALSRLRRHPSRRRKTIVPGITRYYVSGPFHAHSQATTVEAKPNNGVESEGLKEGTVELRKALRRLLNSTQSTSAQYDEVWELYSSAGFPPEYDKQIIACLSSSNRSIDRTRVQRVSERVPAEARSAEDYEILVKSLLSAHRFSEVLSVCREAVGRGLGHSCWGRALAYFLRHGESHWLRALWEARPLVEDMENWLSPALPFIVASSVPESLMTLLSMLKTDDTSDSLHSIADALLQLAFESPDIVHEMTTDATLAVLRKYNDLGMLEPGHYFEIIMSLLSHQLRPLVVRAIVVYRNFSWLMSSHTRVPKDILISLLKALAHFRISNGVEYLLEEFSRSYGRPDLEAYRHAFLALSRAGAADALHRSFESFLRDHGKPMDLRLVTPLLYVYARAGDVHGTMQQFQRLESEFDLQPNHVCWNILITAQANAGDLEGMMSAFDKMLERDQLNSHSFGIVMGFCANRGDVTAVRKLLMLAKERRVPITTPMLDTVVEAYCNTQRLDLAELMAEACISLRTEGSRLRMWNVLLWNHAYRMDLESISRIRLRMEEHKLQPDGMTYSALMLSLVLVGRTDAARQILRTLSRSRRIHVTEFHYTIILYGYVRDRNRDMVHVIYEEIKERFGRPNPSSQLLALRNSVQRDLETAKHSGASSGRADLRLDRAEKLLEDSIAGFDRLALNRRQPLPGIGRRPFSETFPAAYYEYIIAAYGAHGALHEVQRLLDQYKILEATASESKEPAPLRLLAALMLSYLKAEQYEKVEESWIATFSRVTSLFLDTNVQKLQSLKPSSSADVAGSAPNPSIHTAGGSKNKKPQMAAAQNAPSSILPAFRFVLSRCLSLYIRSLACRNEISRAREVIGEVQKAGFSLTTYNWSVYVQTLSSSDAFSDRFEAFTIFEEKFMPNFPGWSRLRRGMGLRPKEAPRTAVLRDSPTQPANPAYLGKESRKYWSQIQPDYMHPTYLSIVHLAAALLVIRRNSISEGDSRVTALFKAAPKTITAIAEMPYLRDKFQGVLLRGRQAQMDKGKTDKLQRQQPVWTGGVLGVGGEMRAGPDFEESDDGSISGLSEQEQQQKYQSQLSFSVAPDNRISESLDEPADEAEPVFTTETIEAAPESPISHEDAFDIEVETALRKRRMSLSHDEQRASSDSEPTPANAADFSARFDYNLSLLLEQIEGDR